MLSGVKRQPVSRHHGSSPEAGTDGQGRVPADAGQGACVAPTGPAGAAGAGDLPRVLEDLLRSGDLRTEFQPILDLRRGAVAGYEALTRGPAGHPLESPLALFQIAEEAGRVVELDLLCLRTALTACARTRGEGWRLFLNVHPLTVAEPDRLLNELLTTARRAGVDPRVVVLEITERAMGVASETFRAAAAQLRAYGFTIAVDDLGAGYSNLAAVAALRPDLIKLDRSLVQEVHLDPTRRSVVEAFVELAHRMGTRVVAEGIETEPELEQAARAGVDLGQGFLIGRPAPELREPQGRILECIHRAADLAQRRPAGQDIRLGEVAVRAPTIPRGTRLADALPLLEDPESEGVLVVTDGAGRPEGLLVKHHVFQRLGSRYGYSVFVRRPVDLVMEDAPVMDAGTPLVVVAQLVATRRERLEDYVIVRDGGGTYQGVVSSRQLLDRVAQIHIDIAKHANPLTGLPGNLQIEAELTRRIQGGEAMTVIYADIDRFKLINDSLGFAYGDQVIRLLGQILQDAVAAAGAPDDFVGHVGGDDFIVITRTQDPEGLCRLVSERFQAAVGSANPDGGPWNGGPLPTVSMAVVSNLEQPFGSVLELARIAAAAKQRVKGNAEPPLRPAR